MAQENTAAPVAGKDRTLIEKLKREVRSCPSCGLEVRHPFIDRCPRCYGRLPHVATECPGCVHRMSCPVAPAS